MTALERVVDSLRNAGQEPTEPRADNWRARCPAHGGRSPTSLSLKALEDRVLLYCHAGCEPRAVVDALGLRMADLFNVARGSTYRYGDGRVVHRTPDKRFRQSGNTSGRPELYRLEAVRTAVLAGRPVYVVEGEQDVHALESVGATATCAPMGAGKWGKVDDTALHGATVIVVADKDEPGRKHAADVAASLAGHSEVVVVQALVGKDAADHVAAGHDVSELVPVDVETAGAGNAAPAEPALRRARVTWACDLDYEPPVYAWEDDGHGRVPVGSLSIAAGREATGKSSFGVWLCARITTGTLPGVWHGTPGRVLYAAVEDSWTHTLLPRLIAAGADLSRVGRFDVVVDEDTETSLSLPFDNELLEAALLEHEVRLVVLDPLMSMIGAGIDTHRERDVRTALDPLARMADRTGAVLLGIAHFNKGSGSDAASLITGSGAFKNVPRSVFGFARDEDDENGGRVMTQVKNSTGRDDLPSLSYAITTAEVPTPKGTASTALFTFTGTSERSVRDLLRDARGGNEDPDQDDRQAVETWLRELLEDNGCALPANDVYKHATAAGFSRDQAKRAKSRLGVRAVKGATSWAWQLPEGSTDSEQPGDRSLAPLLPSQVTALITPPQEGKGAREQGGSDGEGCTVCHRPLLLGAPGRTVCSARDDAHTAARLEDAA